jgi:four helix bundle protein
MKKFKFEELNVYRESLEYVSYLYDLTKKWPTAERHILISQLLRAATSIVLNIAEGTSRTTKDFKHFLSTSRGSVYECVAILTIAIRQNYITEDEYKFSYETCLKLARMLTALKRSLK